MKAPQLITHGFSRGNDRAGDNEICKTAAINCDADHKNDNMTAVTFILKLLKTKEIPYCE